MHCGTWKNFMRSRIGLSGSLHPYMCCNKGQSLIKILFSFAIFSGAEDRCAHVWDRHFGAKLATLDGHTNVVNCVAFNPANQQMLVSASDDHTIRVWRSRQLSKLQANDQAESEDFYEEVACSFVEGGLWRETSV